MVGELAAVPISLHSINAVKKRLGMGRRVGTIISASSVLSGGFPLQEGPCRVHKTLRAACMHVGEWSRIAEHATADGSS